MKSRSRRHSIEDLVTLKWTLGALMGLVCITTLFNIHGHNQLPAVVATLAVSIGIVRPAWVAKVPQWIWKFYALAIIPLVLVNVMSKDTIPALLDLNTWLILFRSLNHTKRREEMQLALLCLFLIIMTGILTATLVFGFQLLAFAAIAIAYLLVSTAIESKIEGDYELLERIREKNPMRVGKAFLSLVDTRFAFLGISMFSTLVFIAAMVFIAIPRIDVEDKVSLFKMKSTRSLTGFSDRVQLGEVTSIKNDESIALRVDVPENATVPITPYWRMLALDDYDGGAFSLSPGLVDLQGSPLASPYHSIRYWPDRRFSQTPSNEFRDRWTFFLEPEVSRYLPVLGPFRHMTVSKLSDLSIGPHMHYFALDDINSKMISYQIEGVDLSGKVPDVPAAAYAMMLSSTRDGVTRPNRLSYPQTLLNLPREEASADLFRRMAGEIRDGRKLDALSFARLANRFLWERHDYSLQVQLPPVAGMKDPVARWLESDLPGHCEFFATSFVLLARAAGFPARLVVGFKGGEWNAYENYFMVKNSDAHAWAEIYDGAGSWLRVDPTPGSIGPGTNQATQLVSERVGASDSSAFLDSLRLLWYRRIVNYDEATQREAAIQLKDFFLAYISVAEQWAVSMGEYLYEFVTAPWNIWRFSYFSFLLAILVVAFMIQRNMALNFRELILAPFRRGDPIRRKAGKVLSRISERPSGEAANVFEDLQRLRFGAKESWPNPRLVFKAARRLR